MLGDPHRLGRSEQRGLHLGHELLQALLLVGLGGQHVGEGGRVAEVHQQGHFVGAQAEQMLVVVVRDFHKGCRSTQVDVTAATAPLGEGKGGVTGGNVRFRRCGRVCGRGQHRPWPERDARRGDGLS